MGVVLMEDLLKDIKRGLELMTEERPPNRLDNGGWTIYKVGEIIRIDIKRSLLDKCE